MRDLLASIHPGLERVLDPTNKARLVLLGRYVTPEEVRRAGPRRITARPRAGHAPGRVEALVGRALQGARAQRVAVPGEGRAAELVRELAAEALAARQRLARLDAELEEALARHPDAALIRSLPGMGATLTAEFIAEAGGIGRFAGPGQLAAAAGLAPVLKQSGKVRYLTAPAGATRPSSGSCTSRPSARCRLLKARPSTPASAPRASGITRRSSRSPDAGSTCSTPSSEPGSPIGPTFASGLTASSGCRLRSSSSVPSRAGCPARPSWPGRLTWARVRMRWRSAVGRGSRRS